MIQPQGSIKDLLSDLIEQLMGLLGDKLGSTCGDCDIPPPCWYPREVGRARSQISVGGVATISLLIKNGGPKPRTIQFRGDADVTVKPAELLLWPMEQGTVIATATDPQLASPAAAAQHVLWILGGQAQYVVWELVPGELTEVLPTAVNVVDQPDYLHHWYDHFYCVHPPPWTPDSFVNPGTFP